MIVTVLNQKDVLVDQVKVLVQSLADNSPEDRIRVYLVDFDEDLRLDQISSYCEVVHRRVGLSDMEDVRGFMVCYRSVVLKEVMQEVNEPVAWFDCDVIVRHPLRRFWDGVTPSTLKIMLRDEQQRDSRFQAGIFALGVSEATLDMMIEFNGELQKRTAWFADQLLLYDMYLKHSGRVSHLQLDKRFNDWHFSPDSSIWHCKSKHFKERAFQSEFQHYLRKAKT